ncbi:S-adenosyl-L-methionine-dependent methyltransferase [Ktedonobacter sp. SOSP1-52]|nr:S-adenosyl-L-methionine-dependent methyltransferase [Ktedonobacter sp. SOSP1-52]
MAWVKGRPGDPGFWPVLRTRFLDDLLGDWMRATSIRQIVLLAAGLDTRAYRLAWPPEVRLFELDQEEIFSYKEPLLAQTHAIAQCQRTPLSVNLEGSWAQVLLEAGFDPGCPSIWIIEGLLFYLKASTVLHIMETVSQLAAADSWLSLDIVNQAALTSSHQEQLRRQGVAWQFGVDEPQQWLHNLGWDASVSPLGEIALRYGRWPYAPPPVRLDPAIPRTMFVVAQRRMS